MTLEIALTLTRLLGAFAVALQTLELLALRRHFEDDGIWSWRVLRDDYATWPRPLRSALDVMLSARGFRGVLLLQLMAAPLAAVASFAWPVIFVTTLLASMRFRGSFNGGSDTMTLVVSSALSAHALFASTDFGDVICLGYIAFHAVASYFVAGLAKVRAPLWRSGDAARAFLVQSTYPVPASVRAFAARSPRLMRVATYAVLLFELAFPLVFVRPLVVPMLGLGLAFHLANFAFFGLNRFVWAWLATYPALTLFGLRGLG